jgi:hypothetical protein
MIVKLEKVKKTQRITDFLINCERYSIDYLSEYSVSTASNNRMDVAQANVLYLLFHLQNRLRACLDSSHSPILYHVKTCCNYFDYCLLHCQTYGVP